MTFYFRVVCVCEHLVALAVVLEAAGAFAAAAFVSCFHPAGRLRPEGIRVTT